MILTMGEPNRIAHEEVSALIQDLNLPKDKAELVGSRLKQWNILDQNVKVSVYRCQQNNFLPYFKEMGIC